MVLGPILGFLILFLGFLTSKPFFLSFSAQNHAESFGIYQKSQFWIRNVKNWTKTHFSIIFARKTYRFLPLGSILWWFWRALEFCGWKMTPNEYEITSKSQFWTRSVRNCIKSRHVGYPADRVSPRRFPPLLQSIYLSRTCSVAVQESRTWPVAFQQDNSFLKKSSPFFVAGKCLIYLSRKLFAAFV